jgi:hypothetical protein
MTGKILPLCERAQHDPGRGRRLLALAAVRQPEYPPRLRRHNPGHWRLATDSDSPAVTRHATVYPSNNDERSDGSDPRRGPDRSFWRAARTGERIWAISVPRSRKTTRARRSPAGPDARVQADNCLHYAWMVRWPG